MKSKLNKTSSDGFSMSELLIITVYQKPFVKNSEIRGKTTR